jgi:Na+-transporting methylmalonyl-CoA/oxaloacetate decarboxylase beta subunit
VLWLDDDGEVSSEELTLSNDTTQVLSAPVGAIAFWILPAGAGGVAAAVHLRGQDVVGPYLSAASVPAVPWSRQVPRVVSVLP